MEKALALLENDGVMIQWCDRKIFAGSSISDRIKQQMDQAHIAVFLLSNNFIASRECRKEWRYFNDLQKAGKSVFRIPVILSDCPWEDFLGEDDVKALPEDGFAVSSFPNQDTAWRQVYEGVKNVVDHIRSSFTPMDEFLSSITVTEFLSNTYLNLQDIFIFPRLTSVEPLDQDPKLQDITIDEQSAILSLNRVLVFGEENSGKTALARHLYLTLLDKSRPVLMVESEHLIGKHAEIFLRAYHSQYHGDYVLWGEQANKTLILDTTTAPSHMPEIIAQAEKSFEQIIVILSSDDYYTYFRDNFRLVDFRHMKIEPLTLGQQERLIRKRLILSHGEKAVFDGMVDQAETRVNSIVISNRILPRYPFYILSILQTYEEYMPVDMSITSYGHCYLVLIIANLIRSGIAKEDDQLNTCFNFAEHLAFAIYRHDEDCFSSHKSFQFDAFLESYKQRYIISNSIVNSLMRTPYGLIDSNGKFRAKYMFYYFLGKFLASNSEEGVGIIETMCQESHKEINFLTILFTIHHTHDTSIIDDIVARTKNTLDYLVEAQLSEDETRKFAALIDKLPGDIQSRDSVAVEREKERKRESDLVDGADAPSDETDANDDMGLSHDIRKILKNNRILGQVLRTKYGSLERVKIQNIIEVIAGGGLRLVNLFFQDERELSQFATHLNERKPDYDLDEIKMALRLLSFIWTLAQVELVVAQISVPEIQESIDVVVRRRDSPAFDLIGYFSQLSGADRLGVAERDYLVKLLRKHRDDFVRRVLSIQTQRYMNTHRSRAAIEQSICKHLGIVYRPKPIQQQH